MAVKVGDKVRSRYVPGTNVDKWWVLAETEEGRQAVPSLTEDHARHVYALWEIGSAPFRATPARILGVILIDPSATVAAVKGEQFDPDTQSPRFVPRSRTIGTYDKSQYGSATGRKRKAVNKSWIGD